MSYRALPVTVAALVLWLAHGCATPEAKVFRITPERPVAELRGEALKATPPVEAGVKRTPDLVELVTLDPGIKLDIRYAGTDNFLSTPLYTQARAFLQRPAAEGVLRAHRALATHGYGLLIHDAYRPWWVTKVFWEATPPKLHDFVADPSKGSRHNRGSAVDLTLYELKTGEPVGMPGLYDEMSERSYPTYAGGTPEQRRLRDLLRAAMEAEGFAVYETEWWHFDHQDWREYPIVNLNFEDLSARQAVTNKVDALFAPWDKPDSPGCSAGVIQDGQFVYRRGYGMANLELDVPLSSESVFYIASTSKQFAAAAVALLVLDGKLSLEEPLRKFFPELPQGVYGGVTVRHLLHHVSGIRDYLTLMYLGNARFEDVFSNDQAVALIARQKALNHKPGEQHLYSNSNYLLLALIVQKVSGKSLRDYAQAEIFGPLGMRSTQFRDDRSVIVKNRVSSYEARPDGGFKAYHTNFELVGDGGLLTSVDDLLRWDQNFYQDKLRGGKLPPLLLTGGVLNNGEKLDYAFGLFNGDYRGLKTVAHGGAFNSFVAELMRFPEQRFSVAVLCNLYGPRPSQLTRQIADLYLAGQLTAPVAASAPAAPAPIPVSAQIAPPDAAQLARYAGDYYSDELNTSYRLALKGGKLHLTAGQIFERTLEAAGTDEFRTEDGLGTLRFTRDRNKRLTGFSLDAGRALNLRFAKSKP